MAVDAPSPGSCLLLILPLLAMIGSAAHEAKRGSFAAVPGCILRFRFAVRCRDNLLRQALVAVATAAVGGGGQPAVQRGSDEVLGDFQATLRDAGEVLGLR